MAFEDFLDTARMAAVDPGMRAENGAVSPDFITGRLQRKAMQPSCWKRWGAGASGRRHRNTPRSGKPSRTAI